MVRKLLETVRGRNFKRIQCLLLIVCLLASLFAGVIGTLSISAAEQQKMLHIESQGKNVSFGQNVELEQYGSYRISYYYKFVSGELNTSATLKIKDELASDKYDSYYSSDAWPGGMTLVHEDEDWYYSEYDFTFWQESGTYSVCFEFGTDTEMYLYDMKLTYNWDTGNNFMANTDLTQGLSGWRTDWTAGGNGDSQFDENDTVISLVNYDEAQFARHASTDKKMLHIESQGKSVSFGQNVELEQYGSYRISYYYRFVSGELNTSATLKIKDELASDKYDSYYSSDAWPGGMTLVHEDEDWYYSEYDFTFWQESGIYSVCFEFGADTEMYLYDMKLTYDWDTDNNFMTNTDLAQGLSGWRTDWTAGGSGGTQFDENDTVIRLVDYDETQFMRHAPTDEKMLHIESQGKNVSFGQNVALEQHGSYKISYYYKFVTGGINTDVTLKIKDAMASNKYDSYYSSDAWPGGMTLSYEDEDWYYSEYTFTFGQESGTYSLCFEFGQAAEMYLYDMKLTDEGDADANLMTNTELTLGLSGWRTDWTGGTAGSQELSENDTVIRLVNYDETQFVRTTPAQKKMLHIQSEGKSVSFGQNVTLQEGQSYKISYYYKFITGAMGAGVSLKIKDALASDNYESYYGSDGWPAGLLLAYEDTNLYYSQFTFTFEQPSGIYSLCFSFGTAAEMYLYDIKLANTANDGVNLIANADLTQGLSGWRTDWVAGETGDSQFSENGTVIRLVNYDESVFKRTGVIEEERKMLYIKNLSGSHTPFLQRVLLQAEKTYNYSVYIASSLDFDCMVYHKDVRVAVFSVMSLIKKESFGDYYRLTYRFTMPSTVAGEPLDTTNIFIGIQFPPGVSAYVFDARLWEDEAPAEKNILVNAGFNDGLDYWIFGWSPWFILGQAGLGHTEYRAENCELVVMDYDEARFVTYFNDDRFSDGEWWSAADIVTSDAEETGTLKGYLKNEKGKVISGGKMLFKSNLAEFETTTDKTGYFEFKDIASGYYELFWLDESGNWVSCNLALLTQNRIVVTVSVTITVDYEKIYTTIEDNSADDTDDKSETGQTGIIRGQLMTADKKAMPAVTVYLRNFGTVVTDADGRFEFEGVPSGEYEIYIVKENGQEHVFRTVQAKSNIAIEIKLTYREDAAPSVGGDAPKTRYWLYIVIGSAVVLLAAGGVAAVVFLRKKRSITNS